MDSRVDALEKRVFQLEQERNQWMRFLRTFVAENVATREERQETPQIMTGTKAIIPFVSSLESSAHVNNDLNLKTTENQIQEKDSSLAEKDRKGLGGGLDGDREAVIVTTPPFLNTESQQPSGSNKRTIDASTSSDQKNRNLTESVVVKIEPSIFPRTPNIDPMNDSSTTNTHQPSYCELSPVMSGDDWQLKGLNTGWEFPERHRWRFRFATDKDLRRSIATGGAFAVKNRVKNSSHVVLVKRDKWKDESNERLQRRYKDVGRRYSLPETLFDIHEDEMLTTTLELAVRQQNGSKATTTLIEAMHFSINMTSLQALKMKEIDSMQLYEYSFIRHDVQSKVNLIFERVKDGYQLQIVELLVLHRPNT